MADPPPDGDIQRWTGLALRVKDDYQRDDLSLVSGGMAFYGLLALAPGLAALVSVYGLFSTPADVQRQVASLSKAVPAEVRQLLDEQLTQVVSASGSTKGIGVLLGLVVALVSSSAAMRHLLRALARMGGGEDSRGFVALRLRAVLLTLAAIVFLVLVLVLLAVVPAVTDRAGASGTALSILRWPALVMLMMGALSVLYRLGPDRHEARGRWVTWGSAIATGLWLVASVAYSIYASSFGNYAKTYGSMAAVVVTLVWLWITSLCILLGAEINRELERAGWGAVR
jgi:membrane protein